MGYLWNIAQNYQIFVKLLQHEDHCCNTMQQKNIVVS